MNIPEKIYWLGEDIETLPREKLIEIIRELGRDLVETRSSAIVSAQILRPGSEHWLDRLWRLDAEMDVWTSSPLTAPAPRSAG